MEVRFKILISIFSILAIGCASTDERSSGSSSASREYASYDDDGPNIHPSAYTMDLFFVPKAMPKRPVNNPDFNFFYKRCEQSRRATYYSRTSYGCDSLRGF